MTNENDASVTFLSTQTQLHHMIDAGDSALQLSDEGIIAWGAVLVARLQKGESLYKPDLVSMASLSETDTVALLNHVHAWLGRTIDKNLQSLFALTKDTQFTNNAKLLQTALVDKMGTIYRESVATQVKALTPEERTAFRAHGVRFGEYAIFIRDLLRPAAVRLKILLHAIANEHTPHAAPPAGVAAPALVGTEPTWYWELCGYRVCDTRAVRCDMIEKLADVIRPLTKRTDANPKGEFSVTAEMMSFIGRSGNEFSAVLQTMGYQSRIVETPVVASVPAAPPAADDTPQTDVTPTLVSDLPTVDLASDVQTQVLWSRKPLRAPRPAVAPHARRGDAPPRGERFEHHSARVDGEQQQPRKDFIRRDRQANMSRAFQATSNMHEQKNFTSRPLAKKSHEPSRNTPIDPENPFAVLLGYSKK